MKYTIVDSGNIIQGLGDTEAEAWKDAVRNGADIEACTAYAPDREPCFPQKRPDKAKVEESQKRFGFQERLRQFNNAAHELLLVWERCDTLDPDIGIEGFPFEEDFAQVVAKISTWNEKQKARNISV